MQAAIYIPNFNGARHLPRVLRGLAAQTRPARMVLVDNGSDDDSVALTRRDFPDVEVVELGENLGFGRALNRAIASHPAEALILLNNDTDPQPRFVEALLDGLGEGVDAVAGVLLQERSPETIDSAGVIADETLMAFDYLNGEPVAALEGAADPLGPTGGAALYRRAAFEAVGGFDERIFLYYEDLDLALRMAGGGGTCRLAPEAQALHAYSASLGARSGAKFAHTGWSRGYLLRRYRVLSQPRKAARALACEATICAGQLLGSHTAAGLRGRLRGWRDAAGLSPRDAAAAALSPMSARQALSLRRNRG
ncbi:MAG TPA: glycosyltransferase family 2 protein [Solirubrobacterales bacterium]|nr:glycosyltransferase family 2 protein [Solirubrobacterales bacterium]